MNQWKVQVGPINFIKQSSGGGGASGIGIGVGKEIKSLSKAEQKFYQQICDLILAADTRSNNAVDEVRTADLLRIKAELNLKICENRLKGTVCQLQKYRMRSTACEQMNRSDMIQREKKDNKLISLLNINLIEYKNKINKLTNDIYFEKRKLQLIETSRTAETLQLRKLQLKTAELESKGSSVLRGRDDAIYGFENRIKESEDNLCNWIKTELPRLLSGLPLPEDSMATFFDNPSVPIPRNYVSSSIRNVLQNTGELHHEVKENNTYTGNNTFDHSRSGPSTYGVQLQSQTSYPVTDRLMGALSVDRTYALAQSLCTCKAAHTAQEMRISALQEKNSILKERSLEMQGVLIRWEEDIEATSVYLNDYRTNNNVTNTNSNTIDNDKKLNDIRSNHHLLSFSEIVTKSEKSDLEMIELKKNMMEIRFENIELQNEIDRYNNQLKDMSNIIDIMNDEENVIKNERNENTMKWRNKMENNHFEELKSLRIESEEEKRVLKVRT